MNALLRAGLADPDNAQFAFLSGSTLPVKPFPEVYAALVGHNSSYFCITPTNEWIRHGAQYVVKHHQWLSLSRPHATRIAFAADSAAGYRLPMSRFQRKCCEDEFAYLHAVLGEIDPSDNPGWGDVNGGQRLTSPHNTEQGACHTYVFWDARVGSVFSTIPLDGCRARSQRPAMFATVTMGFLWALRISPFLFARKFAFNCSVTKSNRPLAEELARLLDTPVPDVSTSRAQ
eukprot:GGOE01019767.1.p1 GENE.GGOE01019767.1~~GGOE01019767.1.p1  ORF type:complete len:231 (+),score=43.93 GGOE01019767.1:512-1204(+)